MKPKKQKLLVLLFLTFLNTQVIAQSPNLILDMIPKPKGDEIPNIFSNTKLVYNIVGEKDGLENIVLEGKILLNSIIVSNNFELPILGNITPPTSSLNVDSTKQNLEKILLENQGIYIGVFPTITFASRQKSINSFTFFLKGKVNGLKDSAENINKLYQLEGGLESSIRFSNLKFGKYGILYVSISRSMILNNDTDFKEKFEPFSSNKSKGWFNLNSYLMFPILNDNGAALLFNYRISTKTVGVFSAGLTYTLGM